MTRMIEPPDISNLHRVGAPNWSEFQAAGRRISRQLLTSVLREVPQVASGGMNLLDFGCGCGRVLYPMLEMLPGHHFHAVDVDRSAVDYLRTQLPDIDLRCTDFHPPLPFSDQYFDLIYSISIWTHLSPPDQISWLAELARVTKRGGYLFISTSSHSALKARKLRGDPGWSGVTEDNLNQQGVIFVPYDVARDSRDLWTPGITAEYGLTLNAPSYCRENFNREMRVEKVLVDHIDGVQDLVVLQR